MNKRETNEAGQVKCARCTEFKDPEWFNAGDSYCKPCRKAYAAEYHARRKLEDPLYLVTKAARLRRKYRNDPAARARRLESIAKYRSRLERDEKRAEEGKPPATPPSKKAEVREQKSKIDQKWSDL